MEEREKPLRKTERPLKIMRAESHSPGLLEYFDFFNSWLRGITPVSKII
jgi:hypothetical protein